MEVIGSGMGDVRRVLTRGPSPVPDSYSTRGIPPLHTGRSIADPPSDSYEPNNAMHYPVAGSEVLALTQAGSC